MALFDGSGSFGLGLGGFDVSDFTGFTGDGGFGSMNFDKIGNTGTLNIAEDNINRVTDGAAFDPKGGLANLPGYNTNTNTPGVNNTGSSFGEQALGWANLANSLYKDWDARDYRDKIANNKVKTQNDTLAGKKHLAASYYGTVPADGSANPIKDRKNYETF